MKYLSPSRIHLLDQCGLSFKFSYVDGEPKWEEEEGQFYANYGKLLHDVYERIAKKEYFIVEKAIEHFNDRFSSCNLPENIRVAYYEQGIQSIKNKYEELNKLNIISTEQEFHIPIDFAMPPLHGFIDLVYRDEKDRLIVRDYKSSKVYGNSEISKQYQQYIYPLVCKQLLGETPFKFEFDFVRFNETKEFIITDSFLQMGMIKVKGAWNKIKQEKFEANYSPFFCQNFCNHKHICPVYIQKNGL